MESKKINQLATELTPSLSDLTIIGDPSTGISKKITLSQMASLFTGTVEEYPNLASFPLVGVADTIYIALDTNVLYRWNTGTNAYVELSPNIINSLVFSDANGFDGNISLVGSVATLTITTALTTGSVPFIGASGALSQDNANLFFDDTNNRLGINTNAPTTALDVFGSNIIGRLNATSTNNAFLGFASAGSNKWSIGNVQSDHRFRIYNEATTSELVSVLSTGEFGIGIANPTTKFHIDGAATALIANLDANVSVAKSISFRSDNSNRINLEVSGTESGSNAGANFFLRTYTDAGSLIETPFSIVRSTGVTTIKSLTLTNALSIANGGTGSTTQNFVDLTTNQSIGGTKTFTSPILANGSSGISGSFISSNFFGSIDLENTGGTVTGKWNIQANSGAQVGASSGSCFGIYSYVASAYRLFISGSGNVGIGTITPTQGKLVVANSGNSTIYNSETSIGVNSFWTSSDGSLVQFGSASNHALWFYTNNTVKAVIAAGGNFGIGTNNPTQGKLVVANSGPSTIYNSETSVGVNSFWTSSDGSIVQFGSLSNHPLFFYTNNTVKAVILANGNFGIGTNNPSNILTVQSNDTFAQDSSGQIVIKGASNTAKRLGIGFDTTSNYSYLQSIEAGVSTRPIVLQPFGGNVLINTTSDTGFNFVGSPNGHSFLGNTIQISAGDYGGTERQGAFGVSEWANQSSAVINLASIFPRITFSSRALSVLVQIGTANTSTSHCSALVLFSRTSNGGWSSSIISNINNGGTVINSVSGSGTSITINFNVATFGSAMITILNRA